MADKILGPAIKNYVNGVTSIDIDSFFTQFIKNNYIYKDLVPTVGVFPGNITINSAGEAIITKPKFKDRLYVKVFAPYPQYSGKDGKKDMEKDLLKGLLKLKNLKNISKNISRNLLKKSTKNQEFQEFQVMSLNLLDTTYQVI